jgi:hypothetical protein
MKLYIPDHGVGKGEVNETGRTIIEEALGSQYMNGRFRVNQSGTKVGRMSSWGRR